MGCGIFVPPAVGAPRSGFVQQPAQIAARFAITIWPYSLGITACRPLSIGLHEQLRAILRTSAAIPAAAREEGVWDLR